jgi:ribonuclease E
VVEHTAPIVDETPSSVEEVAEHHPKALEEEHEPKPLV